MRIFLYFGCFAAAILISWAGNPDKYCFQHLCKPTPHIGCTDSKYLRVLSPECPPGSESIDITPYRRLIVVKHNQLRNEIASGNIRGYQPAQRMATMTWNKKLADLAQMNANRCKSEHDCHNTPRYRYSGQNLAYRASTEILDEKIVIEKCIEDWFKEYENADMSQIDKFTGSRDIKKMIGHFTVMVAEKNVQVGCGLVKYPMYWAGRTLNKLSLTCNYATTNMMNHPIYMKGQPASKCKTGRNPNYPNLCSKRESYNINTFS